ncbi:hypothetical protein LOK49_LG04G00553 [Camellia lanceoleosa]|uniref:Uncharacterized protein n=1 Tax=Camellia lanceoleosa TaxID=1840588 RepID=A0ACC0I117_9ERIC|nr:hypothetical protein LOK49_LG04G00553 [Camellia lanceoleosa]
MLHYLGLKSARGYQSGLEKLSIFDFPKKGNIFLYKPAWQFQFQQQQFHQQLQSTLHNCRLQNGFFSYKTYY